MPQRLKKRSKNKSKSSVIQEIKDMFSIADAKDKDFDLNMDSSTYKSAKGQAGNRFKGYPQ